MTDCPPRPMLHLVIELRDNGPAGVGEPIPVGWTKLYLFDAQSQLASGRWRLRIRKPPVRLNAVSTTVTTMPRVGHAEVCVRLVDGRFKGHHEAQTVPLDRQRYLPDGVLGGDLAIMAGLARRVVPPPPPPSDPPPLDATTRPVLVSAGAKSNRSRARAPAPTTARKITSAGWLRKLLSFYTHKCLIFCVVFV